MTCDLVVLGTIGYLSAKYRKDESTRAVYDGRPLSRFRGTAPPISSRAECKVGGDSLDG
ncbi:hypothetical protein BH09MYX1_BH09MYX1_37740 [soil metagenome]